MELADPTLEFLKSLDDPALYVVKRGIPIFKAHKRKAKRGDQEVDIVVTDDDLATIAENCEALESDHGVVMRMTLGHVNAELSDSDPKQPPIVGAYRNARVGRFGPRGELCILADQYLRRDKLAEVQTGYPYRSGEYYPESQLLRGVALLKRDPFLDLGMVVYQPAGPCYTYASETSMSDEKKPEEVKPESTNPAPAAPGAAGTGEPADHAAWKANMDHYQKSTPWVGYAMKCYDASAAAAQPATGPSTPGANNVAIPGDDSTKVDNSKLPAGQNKALWAKVDAVDPDARGKGKDGKRGGYERSAMKDEWPTNDQADQQAVIYQQLNDRLQAVEAENNRLRLERETEACRNQVMQLEALGYSLDRGREVKLLVSMQPTERLEHIAYAKAHYQRTSVNQPFVQIYSGPSEIGSQPAKTTPGQAGKAALLAKEEGITFDAALAKVKAG